MGNMYTTKTINYKDGQHVYHQNNSIQRSATCIGNMYTTKTTINYKDGQHVHHQNKWLQTWATCTSPKQLTTKMGNMYTTKTINYKDGQHVHHQNN